jgi:hypothetical protein
MWQTVRFAFYAVLERVQVPEVGIMDASAGAQAGQDCDLECSPSQKDYPLVKYWTRCEWMNAKAEADKTWAETSSGS